jgi:hypothetical protein
MEAALVAAVNVRPFDSGLSDDELQQYFGNANRDGENRMVASSVHFAELMIDATQVRYLTRFGRPPL